MSKVHAIDRVVAMALEPWAITPDMLGIVAGILARRMAHAPAASDMSFITRPANGLSAAPNGVAVIPMHGVIAPRMNLMSDISGGATFEEATVQLREAVAAPQVGTIVVDWDSPGGSVAGATEFAREMLKARAVKPVISHANFLMGSAAYWTGACATQVVAAPSATVGSIGVYMIHKDLSKALADLGVKVTFISAGKYKVDGNETEPLSETAHARMKEVVQAKYARFISDVALGRGVAEAIVRDGYGQGTTLTADEALAAKMIDRIETLDETLARVLSSPPALTPGRAAADPPVPDATLQEPHEATSQERRTHRETEAAMYASLFR